MQTDNRDWVIYNVRNNIDMDNIYLYHKPTKECYHSLSLVGKCFDEDSLLNCVFDIGFDSMSICWNYKIRVIKIHENDFFGDKLKSKSKVTYV